MEEVDVLRGQRRRVGSKVSHNNQGVLLGGGQVKPLRHCFGVVFQNDPAMSGSYSWREMWLVVVV